MSIAMSGTNFMIGDRLRDSASNSSKLQARTQRQIPQPIPEIARSNFRPRRSVKKRDIAIPKIKRRNIIIQIFETP